MDTIPLSLTRLPTLCYVCMSPNLAVYLCSCCSTLWLVSNDCDSALAQLGDVDDESG